MAAYDLYLQGRSHWTRLTPDGYRQALACYKRAVEIDPAFAAAHAATASAQAWVGHIEGGKPSEIYPQGKAAALRALELDDGLAEAHAALGYIQFVYDWDWGASEASFRRAIELNPSSASAHHQYSIFLGNLARFDEAIDEGARALALDPLWAQAAQNLGWWLVLAGRPAEGTVLLKRALDLEPDFPLARINLGLHLLAEQPGAAIAELERASSVSDRSPIAQALLAYAYAAGGQRPEANAILRELVALAERQYVSAVFMAVVQIGLEEYDEALRWLERGFEERAGGMTWLPHLFVFDPLRDNPRFAHLMRRLGFGEKTTQV